MAFISKVDPEIVNLANDRRGPFRKRNTSPQNISLELDEQERETMLSIWKTMYNQLLTPQFKRSWIQNQGRADYELSVENYESWISSLAGEGCIADGG